MSSRRKIGTRPKLKELEKRRVWVRSGGRCAICNRDLLDGGLTCEPVSLGELAHIVGQRQSSASPRGMTPYPIAERDLADNILLACGECHSEIDDPLTLNLFSVEKLRDVKRRHEERIRHLTGLESDRRTVVLRMIGQLRGKPLELAQRSAVEAVLASSDRFPYFKLSYDRVGVEIDLRRIPGEFPSGGLGDEEAPTREYYEAAKSTIDDIVDHTLNDGLSRGDIEHLSVFAFARLPLLVYLGSKLGDGYNVDVYQRHQVEDSWAWPPPRKTPVRFRFDAPEATGGKDGVLLASVSGTVHDEEIPAELVGCPVFRVYASSPTPKGGIIDSTATLGRFRSQLRAFFGELEQRHKNITRLHVFGALPIASAIALGRMRNPLIQPAIVTYDRTGYGQYVPAIEIP